MARDLKRTPLVEVQWYGLEKEPKRNKFEPDDPRTWEVLILLENDNKEHMAWCDEIEAMFDVLHPGKNKAANWCPIRQDKEKPRQRQACRMKLKEWIDEKTQQPSEGPTVFDSKGLRWDSSKAIGNGSKLIIGFDFYSWEGKSGAGFSLRPYAAQVVEHVAYEGSVSGITASDFGFASSPEADAAVLAAAGKGQPQPAAEPTDDIPF